MAAFTAVVQQARSEARVKRVCDGRLTGRVVYQVTEEVVVVADSTVQSEEIIEESELRQQALDQFPSELRLRIQSLLTGGFDYHTLREAFEKDGEQGIEALEARDLQPSDNRTRHG